MKFLQCVLFPVVFFCGQLMAQEKTPSIYSPEQPTIVNIWHRVADVSEGLRSVESGEISPDGEYVVSGAKFGYKVMLWRTADGALIWEKAHESEVEAVTFSPDASKIATGGEDFYLRIWKASNGEEIHKIEHPRGLDGITWSHNGNIIATGCETGELFLWDANTYQMLGKVKLGSSINSLQFTKDDSKIAVGGNIKFNDEKTGERVEIGFAKILNVDDLSIIHELSGFDNSVKSIRISSDGKYVATGSVDKRAKLFDFKTGELVHTYQESKNIEAVAFTPDSQFLVTGGHRNKISFYRVKDHKKVYELETVRTEYIDFSDDGRLMVTSHEDSGLLSLYLLVSDTHRIPGLYKKVAEEQLDNRDLKK